MGEVNEMSWQAMKAVGGVQMWRPSFLTSTAVGCNRATNVPATLPQGKHTRYPSVGGWVGSRAFLELMETRKI